MVSDLSRFELISSLSLFLSLSHSFFLSGCGFCERAKSLLKEMQETISFSQEIIIGTDIKTSNAVGIALNLGDLTFPQIIIRGRYTGGSDDLRELVDAGEFQKLLLMNRHVVDQDHPIEWYEPLLKRSQNPELLTVPGSSKYFSKWYCFQFYMYSNLVRYISIFHSILLIICMITIPFINDNDSRSSTTQFLQLIISVLLIDLICILLFGPIPFSPSGVISTYFGWKYRGNTTSSLPYKFVWLIYVATLIPILTQHKLASNSTLATITSTLTNSVVLVVFRF
jgi:glutaredoxin-related protein